MGDVEGLVEKIKDVVPTQEDQVRIPHAPVTDQTNPGARRLS